jgi:hypothetical protein
MALHESDFFPGFEVAVARHAQREPLKGQSEIWALERRVRELELARLNDGRLAVTEAAAQRRELALQGAAIIALCDRVKALEARADGQEGTLEA